MSEFIAGLIGVVTFKASQTEAIERDDLSARLCVPVVAVTTMVATTAHADDTTTVCSTSIAIFNSC